MSRALFLASLMIFLVGCGKDTKSDGTPSCVTLTSKRFQCQAEELAKHSYNTQFQIDYVKAQCERLYYVNKCYSVNE